eukprot:1866405-Rhodomonas_salina.3
MRRRGWSHQGPSNTGSCILVWSGRYRDDRLVEGSCDIDGIEGEHKPLPFHTPTSAQDSCRPTRQP